MEAIGALELLSRGLSEAQQAADCPRGSYSEVPLVTNANGESGEAPKLQGAASTQYGPASLHGAQGGSLSRLVETLQDASSEDLNAAGIPSLSRPISAPPNLGAISASTLFAYPPAESAGCVESLLGDIRYDKQYCEFYRSHARENPSLPKPLEEPSLLDLFPRLRSRGANKAPKEGDNLSAVAAAAAATGEGLPTGATYSGSSTERCTPNGDEEAEADFVPASDWTRKNSLSGEEALSALSRGRSCQQSGLGGPPLSRLYAEGTSPANRASLPAFYSAQQLASAAAAATRTMPSPDPFESPVKRAANSRGLAALLLSGGAANLRGLAALPLKGFFWRGARLWGLLSPLAKREPCWGRRERRGVDWEEGQEGSGGLNSVFGGYGFVHEGALLGLTGSPPPSLAAPSLLGGGLMGISGGFSPSGASGGVGDVLPRESLLLQQRNMLAVQQAAAAAWLMGREGGPFSPRLAARRSSAAPAADAWLASANLRLQAALELGATQESSRKAPSIPLQEQLQRRQFSTRQSKEQKRRQRTESGLFGAYDAALECWTKSPPVQRGMGGAAAREVRGGVVTAPELPLLSGNTRARVAANENNAERVASRGGGGRAKASGGSATPMSSSSAANGVALNARGDEQVSSSPRLSEIDILQADDESLFRTAKDQGGCRLLQRLLADGTPDEVDRVFNMAFSRLEELMTDAYGNYLFQKLLDVCSDDQLRQLLHAITPHLKDICLDPHGTRTAQKLIEVICGSRQSPSLTQELICAFEPLVVDLATDANGNHVIKRFLWCSTRESSACSIDFILKTACDHCVHIATERHGCCVMQRCCEAATGVLKDQILAEVAANALLLSQDPFGNYVVQHVLRHDHARIGSAIIMQLRGHVRELSEQKFASNVVEKCLLLGDSEQRAQVIGELLEDPQQLQQLVLHAYGNYGKRAAVCAAAAVRKARSGCLRILENKRQGVWGFSRDGGGSRGGVYLVLEEEIERGKGPLRMLGGGVLVVSVVQRALAVAGTTQREAVLDVVRFSLMNQHTSQHSRIAQKLMRRFRGLRQQPHGTQAAVTTGAGASAGTSTSGSATAWCCPGAPRSAAAPAQIDWSTADCMQLAPVGPGGLQIARYTPLRAPGGLSFKGFKSPETLASCCQDHKVPFRNGKPREWSKEQKNVFCATIFPYRTDLDTLSPLFFVIPQVFGSAIFPYTSSAGILGENDLRKRKAPQFEFPPSHIA
ncbi:pumilio-family RNA binding repeat domain-containing protein [Cyclospora cayetanensis]|uniref:Pumilio-family RNA binding repeat domain-containing protein n=1 Tax=Cyclospora cayetanensis TaxID=88456 RepID=A0A1D3D7X4_9EIME|nr:pumilio-family RNA binding repeat domain-containing protein [Cyclospora cayetanensis]